MKSFRAASAAFSSSWTSNSVTHLSTLQAAGGAAAGEAATAAEAAATAEAVVAADAVVAAEGAWSARMLQQFSKSLGCSHLGNCYYDTASERIWYWSLLVIMAPYGPYDL